MNTKTVIILLLIIIVFQIFQYVTRDNYKEEFLIEQNKELETKIKEMFKVVDSLDFNITQIDTTIKITKNIYHEKETEIYVIEDADVLRDSIRAAMLRLDGPRFN